LSLSTPKTLEEAIKAIQALNDNQKKLDREIKEIYRLIVDNNGKGPVSEYFY